MKEYIKSPLNYTGNKFRLLPQIIPYFPKEINTMVDLFCGGATVGLNATCKKIIFIDNDRYVIGLLKFLSTCNFETLLADLLKIVNRFNLSCSYLNGYKFYKQQIISGNPNNGLKDYNSAAFYKLRAEYNNQTNKQTVYGNQLLYLLILYGFNNDIRFSKEGNFNLPVGKTDMNAINIEKLRKFIEKLQGLETEFICGDYTSTKVRAILDTADFVYMDPPYLIMDAVYNETNKWKEQSEYYLLELMNHFIDNRIFFVLSNVLEKLGRRNEPLYYWTETMKEKIDIIDIDYHYRSASYNKINRNAKEREVIIMPKRLNNEH